MFSHEDSEAGASLADIVVSGTTTPDDAGNKTLSHLFPDLAKSPIQQTTPKI